LQLPGLFYEAARELAKRESMSMNQFINLLLAEKMSTLMTEECLAERDRI